MRAFNSNEDPMSKSSHLASQDAVLQLIHVLEQLQAALDHHEQPQPVVFTEITALINFSIESSADRAKAKMLASAVEHCVAHRVFAPAQTYLRRLSTILEQD
jgi:hypothetical protein